MATIIELAESRAITVSEEAPAVELIYIISGTEDEQAARAAIEATVPAFYVLPRIAPLPPITTVFQQYMVKHIGGGVWNANASYGKRSPSKIGDVVYNFDTGGGTTHITQSIETSRSYAIDSATGQIVAAPDMKQAINVSKDRVAGVDIGIKAYKWSETHYIPKALLTSFYRRNLKDLTKTVNDDDFREFVAGEVLFEGVSGVKSVNEDFSELTFHFAQSDNADDLAVGDIFGIQKFGWEYLWVVYGEFAAADGLTKQAKYVYVEQVYEEGNFAFLGIGTLPLD